MKIGFILDTKLYLNETVSKDAIFVSLSFIIDNNKYSKVSNVQELFSFRTYKNQITVNQPSIESYINAYKELKSKNYDYIICLVSINFSNDYLGNATLAKSIIKDDNFIVVDSKTFGVGIDLLINEIVKIKDINSIYQVVNKFKENSDFYLVTSTEKSMNLITNIKNKYFRFTIHDLNSNIKKNIVNLTSFDKYLNEKYKNNIINQKYTFYIMYENNSNEAKLLHHELYKINPDNNVVLYNQLPYQIMYTNKYSMAILVRKEEE